VESVPGAKYRTQFLAIEMVSLSVFTLEYALRLWVAVEHEPHRHFRPGGARLRYALSPAGLIDLLTVLPFWLAFVAPSELRVVLVFRVFRYSMSFVRSVARYSAVWSFSQALPSLPPQ
jgi:voltage-gated potassium channel